MFQSLLNQGINRDTHSALLEQMISLVYGFNPFLIRASIATEDDDMSVSFLKRITCFNPFLIRASIATLCLSGDMGEGT